MAKLLRSSACYPGKHELQNGMPTNKINREDAERHEYVSSLGTPVGSSKSDDEANTETKNMIANPSEDSTWVPMVKPGGRPPTVLDWCVLYSWNKRQL